MARTNRSMIQEDEYTSQIPETQRKARRARNASNGSLLVAAGAITDAFTDGALTKAYNARVLGTQFADTLAEKLSGGAKDVELYVPLENLTPSRLAVASLYIAAGIMGAIKANRYGLHEDHLEQMAAQEQQMDRLTTATQLAAGQRQSTTVMPEAGDII